MLGSRNRPGQRAWLAGIAAMLWLFAGSQPLEAQDSERIIRVCNTHDEKYLSVAMVKDNEWFGPWVSGGWFRVNAGKCNNINSRAPHNTTYYLGFGRRLDAGERGEWTLMFDWKPTRTSGQADEYFCVHPKYGWNMRGSTAELKSCTGDFELGYFPVRIPPHSRYNTRVTLTIDVDPTSGKVITRHKRDGKRPYSRSFPIPRATRVMGSTGHSSATPREATTSPELKRDGTERVKARDRSRTEEAYRSIQAVLDSNDGEQIEKQCRAENPFEGWGLPRSEIEKSHNEWCACIMEGLSNMDIRLSTRVVKKLKTDFRITFDDHVWAPHSQMAKRNLDHCY